MKKNMLLASVSLVSLALLFSGCEALRDTHEEAMASLDAASAHYNGQSPYHTSSQTPTENVQWLMIEPFFTSVGTMGGGSPFDQADPLGEAPAGGPSDGTGHANYAFLYPRPAAMPDTYFSLSEGIQFVGKGFKIIPDDGNGKESDHLYYLEIPIQANYNMKVNGGHELRFGLGPYVAAGLLGHYSDTFDGMTQSGSLKFGSNEDYSRMDYGVVLSAGYMISPKISLSLNYDLGLRNINMSDDKLYNRSAGLSLGYRIR